MKQLNELHFPEALRYSKEHEWAAIADETVMVGITDYAQDQLGDIVFVDLPAVGEVFSRNDEFGSIESVKAVSELFLPMGGEVVAVNEALEDSPELVTSAPYGEGWLIAIRPSDLAEFEELLDREAYMKGLGA